MIVFDIISFEMVSVNILLKEIYLSIYQETGFERIKPVFIFLYTRRRSTVQSGYGVEDPMLSAEQVSL